MATLITDPELEERIRAQRAEWGGDRFDEVWEGTYVISPFPNTEHAEIQGALGTVFRLALGFSHPAKIYSGVNVTDHADDWTKNYRGPDVAVVMPGGIARNCGPYLLGGPDFVVEIISRQDRSREKIDFYAKVGVRELLIVDRDPCRLELHRLHDGEFELAGQSTLERPDVFQSSVLPLKFRLVLGDARPRVEARHTDGVQQWVV